MTHDPLSFRPWNDPRTERARRRYLAARLSDLRALEGMEGVGETLERVDALLADTTPLTPAKLLVALADVEETLALCFDTTREGATTELEIDLTYAGAVSWARSSLYRGLADRDRDEVASLVLLLEESGALEELPGSLLREDLVAEPSEVLRVAASLRRSAHSFAVAPEDATAELLSLADELEARARRLSLADHFAYMARAEAALLRIAVSALVVAEHGDGRILLSLTVSDLATRVVATTLLPEMFGPAVPSPTPRVLH
jgi:hypothetical protein